MLFLVGLGLSKDDISIKAMEVCMKCELYADRHTSTISKEAIDYINNATGKEVKDLARQDMEEGAQELVKSSAKTDIAILTGGDPLIATTHKILIIEAKKQKQHVSIVHCNSIMTTAIGESGLDFYKFGKTCTIPSWTEKYKPVSFYETIQENASINAHTLLLLDYESKTKSTLQIKEAVKILERAEQKYKKGIINDQRSIIIMHNLSKGDSKIIYTTIGNAKRIDLDGVNIMILYSNLTGIEKETLDSIETHI